MPLPALQRAHTGTAAPAEAGLTSPRKGPGRASSLAQGNGSGKLFPDYQKYGETSPQVSENRKRKAGKSRLTFTVEEMRLRVLKHLVDIYRKKYIDPSKVSRTIARRENFSELDVRDIIHKVALQFRRENLALRHGMDEARRELLEALAAADEVALEIWKRSA